ncbi:uncharacterized protein LOC114363574 isoform X2 [Ostrinia furnacalis]|uniref:uncharacterized protein LOC114363574 isoform X2 n=1 Tax=Ostrinia furnacalis TaxID=93504 RepID=UPI00103F7076|nr:uncharacterized protein LOC114363574 isoform X2 [Ostrinia furnacalis]
MKSCILLSVVFIQLGWTYGDPAPAGVGAYAYQDSAGNRYGGTYGLDDAKEYASKGKPIGPGNRGTADPWGNFADAQAFSGGFGGGWPNFAPYQQNFQQYDDFFPEYFNNLQTLLNDRLNNFNFGGFPPFEMPMPIGPNSAFAGAAAGPGFTHQVAALNPENPSEPNVNVMSRFGEDVPRAGHGKYVSVSSSSFSSSSNVNGKEKTHKAAETYVNNNGKVTHYRVES